MLCYIRMWCDNDCTHKYSPIFGSNFGSVITRHIACSPHLITGPSLLRYKTFPGSILLGTLQTNEVFQTLKSSPSNIKWAPKHPKRVLTWFGRCSHGVFWGSKKHGKTKRSFKKRTSGISAGVHMASPKSIPIFIVNLLTSGSDVLLEH